MGGVVASFLDRKNTSSLVEHPVLANYRAYGPDSLPLKGSETATSSTIYLTGPRANAEALKEDRAELIASPNLVQRLSEVAKTRASQVAFAYRALDKVVKEEVVLPDGQKKTLDITYVKERQSITFTEMWQGMENFSKGLAELGIPERSVISIYEETRWEWLTTIYAIWLQNMVASTVYANLGEDALRYALVETECKAIICNAKSVAHLLKDIKEGNIPPCIIIYIDELPAGTNVGALPAGTSVVAWTDVVKKGASSSKTATVPTNNDDVALIMYTSGTTGNPKGVMHSHGSLAIGINIMNVWLWSGVDQLEDETYCSYLPMAHILEFGVVSILLCAGALIGFGGPRTLTDMTARPCGDLTEFKPTAMIGVPRIFDTLRRAVESKLPKPGTLKRTVFDRAYASRLAALKEGKETPYWNEKVFAEPRKALGGRVRLMLSGGGPLADSTFEFVNVVFSIMVQGWGLTETVCIGGIQRSGDITPGIGGQVLKGEELKLVDTEDYKHTDKPEPRGELCLRGPFLFKGYYKQPELTKEAIDSEGWFHTGDVGSLDKSGRIKIVGRIKALAKNALGEYIALETLESIYSGHPLVLNNCICVLVHPDKNYVCALIVSDKNKVKAFAEEQGITRPSIEELAIAPELCKAAAKSMSAIATAAKRKPFELLRNVAIVFDDWTPENQLLTAAMKLRRKQISERYVDIIDRVFVE